MNRYVRPVMFAFEPDVVFVFAKASFGAAGAVTLDTNNSKGICNMARNSVAFTGTTAGASPTVSAVSSFAGLYPGMTVTGTGIPASTTISSMTPGSGTITLSQNATGANTGLAAVGGQYIIQFGSKAAVNLDTYNKFLGLSVLWDESGLPGTASVAAGIPAAPFVFLAKNNISVRTIPAVGASATTDATLIIQMGTLSGATFVAADPGNGDIVRLGFRLCRSSAI